MKKRISLMLAIVMVAAMMLTVIPFAALADEAVKNPAVVRLGNEELEDFGVAIEIAAFMEEDVTITLLQDITIESGSNFVIKTPASADGKVYKRVIDGNGHKLTLSNNAGGKFAF